MFLNFFLGVIAGYCVSCIVMMLTDTYNKQCAEDIDRKD